MLFPHNSIENNEEPFLGRILTPPPERRIHPAAPVPLARLPDESGVPVGAATRLGGGAEIRLPFCHRGLFP